MTTAEQLLGLARAVYPSREYRVEECLYVVYPQRTSWVSLCGPVSCVTDVRFDPANNADQAWDVQAWLLNQKPLHYYDGDERPSWFEINSSGVYKMVYAEGEHVAVQSWLHDGTESGLRQAVTDAAVRVCMGVGK